MENKPLKDWLAALKDEEDEGIVKRRPPPTLDLFDDEHDGKIPEDCFFSVYAEQKLIEMMTEQKKMIKMLKAHGKTKHLANRILIIFDDLVGSELFSNARDNFFKMLNANHRHHSVSMLMVTQAYKEIPKTVRTQFSCLLFFEIANDRELRVIYEEYTLSLKLPDWMEIYEYCTDGDYNFMFINYQKPKRLRIMKNFSQYIFADSKMDSSLPQRNTSKKPAEKPSETRKPGKMEIPIDSRYSKSARPQKEIKSKPDPIARPGTRV